VLSNCTERAIKSIAVMMMSRLLFILSLPGFLLLDAVNATEISRKITHRFIDPFKSIETNLTKEFLVN
jgi:hypothetical protein